MKTFQKPPEILPRSSKTAITPDNDESQASLIGGLDSSSKQIEPDFDVALYEILDQIDASLHASGESSVGEKTNTLKEQIKIIAEAVYNRFGGKRTENYLIELIGIQRTRESPIIPLGLIQVGVYRERALLFKLACDMQPIPVTLRRGKFDVSNDPI